MVLTEARPPLSVAIIMVAFFAVFHGHAHGTELPDGQSGLLYSIGFVVCTGLLHGVGIGIGTAHRWKTGRLLLRLTGATVLVGGLFFLGEAIGLLD
jgi:urease accessory protein